ncbi:MAG TPA: TonB-dependent receptor [Bacteroidetes bacterium]|nr:TonB-dependent receptor [Bacteroidota bacterium]
MLRFQGRSPANSENTVFQPAYFLSDLRASYHLHGRPNHALEPRLALHFGINNLFNTSYTNYLSINAFGGRYWNPAAGRNYFAGIQFQF